MGELERDLEEAGKFFKASGEAFAKFAEDINVSGYSAINFGTPVFVKTWDFEGTTLDATPVNLEDLSDEEKQLRETILSARQLFSDLEREAKRSLG